MAPSAAAAAQETGPCEETEMKGKRVPASWGPVSASCSKTPLRNSASSERGPPVPGASGPGTRTPEWNLVEMNWTNCWYQDSRGSNASLDNLTALLCWENITTLKPETTPEGRSSFGTAEAVSGSIGVVVLILLLVGLLSLALKKWRHERLFKKQLRHQTNFLHKSSELSCHADAIYSNVIHLAPWKEDDFAVYANMPPFDRSRRTSPDQVEYASIVFK